MDGMTDISPLTRAEVALRRDPRIRAIKIVPAGWRIAAATGTAAPALAASVCATLTAEQIPASAEVAIAIEPAVSPVLVRRCDGRR